MKKNLKRKTLLWMFDNVYLGRFAPYVFGLTIGRKGSRVDDSALNQSVIEKPYYLCECGRKYKNAQDAAMCGSSFKLMKKTHISKCIK